MMSLKDDDQPKEKQKAMSERALEYSGSEIRVARRISFASAHFYKNTQWSSAQNTAVFGRCYTEHGHGHNYTLEAFLQGPIDSVTGLLINLIDVDKILKHVIHPLDHQHLNFDVPFFAQNIPTTENLARYCFCELRRALSDHLPDRSIQLDKVRLFENEDLWAEYSETQAGTKTGPRSPRLTRLTRMYVIRALHNLENPDVSDTENERLYGMCFRLHGHDYKVMVSIEGPVDDLSGLLPFRPELDRIVDEVLLRPLNGGCLNDHSTNTSGEALAHLWYERLRPHLPPELHLRLAIQETRKNYFERPRHDSAGLKATHKPGSKSRNGRA